METSVEKTGTGVKLRFFLLFTLLFLFLSCHPQRVLVLSDPIFDQFASHEISLYPLRKRLFFLIKGFIPEFIEYASTESYKELVQEKLNSHRYQALVTSYISYYGLDLPQGMRAVLIGGSRDIRYPGFSQILSSDLDSLTEVGSYLYDQWIEQGKLPLILFWEDPGIYAERRETLLSTWSQDDRHILTENWMVLSSSSGDRESRLDEFFRRFDFDTQAVLVLAACPPAFPELLNTLPRHENISLILTIPDNPVLPSGTAGIITPDYKNLLKGSVQSLIYDSPGDIREIENIFIRK